MNNYVNATKDYIKATKHIYAHETGIKRVDKYKKSQVALYTINTASRQTVQPVQLLKNAAGSFSVIYLYVYLFIYIYIYMLVYI